ncbi:hypothetical protein ACFL3M_01745 [Patescibacteria group bacterium]
MFFFIAAMGIGGTYTHEYKKAHTPLPVVGYEWRRVISINQEINGENVETGLKVTSGESNSPYWTETSVDEEKIGKRIEYYALIIQESNGTTHKKLVSLEDFEKATLGQLEMPPKKSTKQAH